VKDTIIIDLFTVIYKITSEELLNKTKRWHLKFVFQLLPTSICRNL